MTKVGKEMNRILLITKSDAEIIERTGASGIDWTHRALISLTDRDCLYHPTVLTQRLHIKTPGAEYLSFEPFHHARSENEKILLDLKGSYYLQPENGDAGATIRAFEPQTEPQEIRIYKVSKKQSPQQISRAIPLTKKNACERALRRLDRKLQELYDSEEFGAVHAFYPYHEEHQLMDSFVKIQHRLDKMWTNQVDQMNMAIGPISGEPAFDFGSQDSDINV